MQLHLCNVPARIIYSFQVKCFFFCLIAFYALCTLCIFSGCIISKNLLYFLQSFKSFTNTTYPFNTSLGFQVCFDYIVYLASSNLVTITIQLTMNERNMTVLNDTTITRNPSFFIHSSSIFLYPIGNLLNMVIISVKSPCTKTFRKANCFILIY